MNGQWNVKKKKKEKNPWNSYEFVYPVFYQDPSFQQEADTYWEFLKT